MGAWVRGVKSEMPKFTERELEVLQLVAQGLSNKEIGKTLRVKERTIEFHVGNILKKLDVGSRVEVAMWTKEYGVVK